MPLLSTLNYSLKKSLPKKRLLLALIIILFSTSFTKAQLTSATIQYKDKVKEKPKVYDGVSDFKYQDNPSDYKQYLGLQVYFPDTSVSFVIKDKQGRKYLDHMEYVTHAKIIKPSYFTIFTILIGDDIDKYFNIVPDGGARGDDVGSRVLIGLKGTFSNEELFFPLSNEEDYHFSVPFILVPFFQAEKKKLDGLQFVIVNRSGKFSDEATNETVDYDKPLFGGIWTLEVNMVKKRNADAEDMYYILKDTIGHVILTGRNEFNSSEIDAGEGTAFVKKLKGNTFLDYQSATPFMLVDTYNAEVERIKRYKAVSVAKNKANRELQIKQLNAKYGVAITQMILKGQVKIGMSSEMCSLAWRGLFGVIAKTVDATGTFQVWKHALYGTKLYMKNDILYKIEY